MAVSSFQTMRIFGGVGATSRETQVLGAMSLTLRTNLWPKGPRGCQVGTLRNTAVPAVLRPFSLFRSVQHVPRRVGIPPPTRGTTLLVMNNSRQAIERRGLALTAGNLAVVESADLPELVRTAR